MCEIANNLFELLFQGTIAGLIVVFVTEALARRKNNRLCCKWCKLLSIEISCHVTQLETFRTIGSTFPTSHPFVPMMDTWQEAKQYLMPLPTSLLEEIANYYVGLENFSLMIQESTMDTPPLNEAQHINFLLKSAEALLFQINSYQQETD